MYLTSILLYANNYFMQCFETVIIFVKILFQRNPALDLLLSFPYKVKRRDVFIVIVLYRNSVVV